MKEGSDTDISEIKNSCKEQSKKKKKWMDLRFGDIWLLW